MEYSDRICFDLCKKNAEKYIKNVEVLCFFFHFMKLGGKFCFDFVKIWCIKRHVS